MGYNQVDEAVRGAARLHEMGGRALRELYDHQQFFKSLLGEGKITQSDYDRIIAASNGEVTRP